jgi:hypothetical protein
MFLWSVFEWGLVVLSAVFVITQLIYPAIADKPTFPLFRKSVKSKDEVEEELREERVCLETEKLRLEVEELRKQKEALIKKDVQK